MNKRRIILIAVTAIIAAISIVLFLSRGPAPEAPAVPGGSPFGSGNDINVPAASGETNTVGQIEPVSNSGSAAATSRLFRLTGAPIAGFTVLPRGRASSSPSLIVRYVDRATGHFFDVSLGSNNALETKRLTNTTIPKVYEAHFRADGLAALLRTIRGETGAGENIAVTLTAPRATSTDALYTLSSIVFRGDIDATRAEGDSLYYVARDSSSIISSAFNGDRLRTLLASPFHDWRLESLGTGLLVYTKANSSIPGFAYSLPSSGALTKLLGPLGGLTAKSNGAGTRLAYTFFESGEPKFFLKNLQSGAAVNMLPAALAEKCVWSGTKASLVYCAASSEMNGLDFDNWYLGRSHFRDSLWSFDTESEISRLIVDPNNEYGEELDIINPRLSPDEDYLVFMNKNDLTLWAIKLK